MVVCPFYATQTQHNNGGHRGDGITAAQSMAFCQTWEPWCWFVCSHFSCCLVSKVAVLIFLKESLSDSSSDAIDGGMQSADIASSDRLSSLGPNRY